MPKVGLSSTKVSNTGVYDLGSKETVITTSNQTSSIGIDPEEEKKEELNEFNFVKYLTSKQKLNLSFDEDVIKSLRTNINPNFFSKVQFLSSWIESREIVRKIPCYLIEFAESDELVLFFHANAEDITKSSQFCRMLRDMLKKNVMAMEYSGYSLYKADKTRSKDINRDAEYLINFLIKGLDIPLKKITIVGRSIGSGPAIHLSTIFQFRMTIIISGMLSIQRVVRDRYSIFGYLIGKYFDNELKVKSNKTPTLFIHGKNDTLIKCHHSIKLQKHNNSHSRLILHELMQHNSFSVAQCVCIPILKFERELTETKLINDPRSKEESEKEVTIGQNKISMIKFLLIGLN